MIGYTVLTVSIQEDEVFDGPDCHDSNFDSDSDSDSDISAKIQ